MEFTQGVHHIGLTVTRLEASADFFKNILNWKEVRRDEAYPAIFVTDNTTMITLWQVKTTPANEFNKNENVGLHHLALNVKDEETLNRLHEILVEENIKIEFSPENLRGGPAKHMMCYEPSGIRVEFISVPN